MSATSETQVLAGLGFQTVDSILRDHCEETAELLGYAVPCPTVLPDGSQPTRVSGPVASSPFAGYFMHPGYRGFGDWAFLTVDFPATDLEGHLVISGSPREVDPRRFIYRDPAPGERVDVLGPSAFRPGGRWIYVPPTSSSIFGGHTVLIWPEGGHTYGVGFHGRGERVRELDLALAERIAMVAPR